MNELSQRDQDYIARCTSFAREVIEPLHREYDEKNHFPDAIYEAAYEWRLMDAAFPAELGGQGIRYRAIALGGLAMARVCAPTAFSLGYNHGSLRPILGAGTEWQRRTFIGELIESKGRASWCMTEEDVSGSNLMGIRSRADKVKGGWLLNGKKIMVGNGTAARLFVCLADAWDDDQRLGLSIFAVPKEAGVKVGGNTRKLGFRCLPTPDVTFDDVFVGDSHLIGSAGGAVQLLLESLDFMRFGGGIVTIGLADGAIYDLLPWLEEREVYGRGRLSDQSHVQVELGRLLAELSSLECLLDQVARGLDEGRAVSREAGSLKLLGSELAMRTTTVAIKLYGWRGTDARYASEKRHRDAQQTSAFEGANEVIAMSLFGGLLHAYRTRGVSDA